MIRLREHLNLIRNSYRRLANELVTQLELIDSFDSEVAQGTAGLIEFPRFLGSVPPKPPKEEMVIRDRTGCSGRRPVCLPKIHQARFWRQAPGSL